jgi:hypothetical protein
MAVASTRLSFIDIPRSRETQTPPILTVVGFEPLSRQEIRDRRLHLLWFEANSQSGWPAWIKYVRNKMTIFREIRVVGCCSKWRNRLPSTFPGWMG